MGLVKLFLTLFGLVGRSKVKKEESLEELKFQDAVRKEKKHRDEKMNEEKILNKEGNQGSKMTYANPWEKAARMLRTEKRRQRMMRETENWERQEREREQRRKKKAERETSMRKEREESILRSRRRTEKERQSKKAVQQRECSRVSAVQSSVEEREFCKRESYVEERVLFNLTVEDGPITIKHCVRLVTVQ